MTEQIYYLMDDENFLRISNISDFQFIKKNVKIN